MSTFYSVPGVPRAKMERFTSYRTRFFRHRQPCARQRWPIEVGHPQAKWTIHQPDIGDALYRH
ncbi:hypothetical protein [Mucilaginibacter sp.]|uniref:hypothetical protein n=1 Tax=Mucilaginibacter sp. TaxID=1882438 RepID=UPI0025CC20B3|nr:hypothetical protein [Mucilaginibacter sp.]